MSTKTLRGTLTRLAERVTTPLLPNDYLDVIDPLLSGIGGAWSESIPKRETQ